MQYVIITPARDEEAYIAYTLESVCKQSLRPTEWIIVDDGSTDNTANIVKSYIEKNPWIHSVYNDTQHEKKASGSKVVRAFYRGFKEISLDNYDFIVLNPEK